MNLKKIKSAYKAEKKQIKSSYKARKRENRKEYKALVSDAKEKRLSDISSAIASAGKKAPQNPPKRALIEEIGNAVTHGVGSVFSIFAIVFMLIYAEGARELVGAWVYFFGLFVMFTMSCLYHAFPYGSCV